MSNYIEYNDKMAFHPGYYVKEIVDSSGISQDDFAKKLGTTPKNLSYLVRGEQSVSVDIAGKLSRMLGTSVDYWLNLQNAYDCLCAERDYQEELKEEKEILRTIGYKYFRDSFHLQDASRQVEQQVKNVREFLKVSSLSVLKNRDVAVDFRSSDQELSDDNVVRANAMVQIAINNAAGSNAPKYNKRKFKAAAKRALDLTDHHDDFYPIVREDFYHAGVLFEVLPNIKGSKINGASKRVGHNVMLMVNDRRLYSDTFWFTLYHEIGHILNGDFCATFEEDKDKEDEADQYARDMLIPPLEYDDFVSKKDFSEYAIRDFAYEIHRDPGIVLGRLRYEGRIGYEDKKLNAMRYRYYINGAEEWGKVLR